MESYFIKTFVSGVIVHFWLCLRDVTKEIKERCNLPLYCILWVIIDCGYDGMGQDMVASNEERPKEEMQKAKLEKIK